MYMWSTGVVWSLCTPSFASAYAFSLLVVHVCALDLVDGDFV